MDLPINPLLLREDLFQLLHKPVLILTPVLGDHVDHTLHDVAVRKVSRGHAVMKRYDADLVGTEAAFEHLGAHVLCVAPVDGSEPGEGWEVWADGGLGLRVPGLGRLC